MKIFLLFIFIISMISCASQKTNKMLELPSISDKINRNETEQVVAYVQLFRDTTNIISVYNLGKYEKFHIYRQDTPKDSFKVHMIIDLTKLDKHNTLRLMPIYRDEQNSQLSNRYKIHPIVNEIEIDELPVVYSTNDSAYFRFIELNERNK